MLDKLFPKEYFKDRLLMLLSGATLVTAVFIVIRILVTVRNYDFKITTGYTQYGADTFIRGEWYELYEPAIFAVITTVIVLMLSLRVYKLNRNLSYGIVSLQLVLLGFLMLVTNAILGSSTIVS